jgi:hypothetical protein
MRARAIEAIEKGDSNNGVSFAGFWLCGRKLKAGNG